MKVAVQSPGTPGFRVAARPSENILLWNGRTCEAPDLKATHAGNGSAKPQQEKDRKLLEETPASVREAGVHILFKANIHQKFAAMDQKTVWYGSINLLSHGSEQESIMRLESPNIAQELMKDLRKSIDT